MLLLYSSPFKSIKDTGFGHLSSLHNLPVLNPYLSLTNNCLFKGALISSGSYQFAGFNFILWPFFSHQLSKIFIWWFWRLRKFCGALKQAHSIRLLPSEHLQKFIDSLRT